jgi:hypothetical protein
MYDPIGRPRRLTRRGVKVGLFITLALLIGGVVTVLKTMPHPQPSRQLSIDELAMMVPDAAQTALVAATVKSRLDQQVAAGPGAAAPACAPSSTPHTWNAEQRQNATTIVQVGAALAIPKQGEIVALATAMQESQLYNLGDLGANNDADSLGLFQQRPSMGWGSPAQVTDPIFSATAFYLALKRVPGWESMAVTDAAQRVERSAYPYAYAQWETDATRLAENILCSTL